MTCHPITQDTKIIGYTCTSGETREVKRQPAGTKWCFNCRKHLPHDFVVFDTVEPSYYGPWGRYDCPQCHQDQTIGFGCSRERDYE